MFLKGVTICESNVKKGKWLSCDLILIFHNNLMVSNNYRMIQLTNKFVYLGIL
jgi:hypothetical protein